MNNEEFKRFWRYLKTCYPYDIKDEAMNNWMKFLQEVPLRYSVNALNTWWEDGRNKKAPTPKEIKESATMYKGKPDLLFRAIRTRMKTGSGYIGNYKPEFRDD